MEITLEEKERIVSGWLHAVKGGHLTEREFIDTYVNTFVDSTEQEALKLVNNYFSI